jgi:hypothetical protein
MSLVRVEAAFETCERHLTETGSLNSEIDAILTSYLCATIYAAMESETQAIVAERAAKRADDPHAANFAKTAARRLVRSIKIGELAGLAGHFDDSCKAAFQKAVDGQTQAAWDNIMLNRHGVTHDEDEGAGSAISHLTFQELKSKYADAMKVLDALRDAIAVEST